MYDSEGLQHALYHNGPISIALDANPNAFRFYSSGVIKTDECNPQPEGLDHAIMVVGYGEEAGALPTRAAEVHDISMHVSANDAGMPPLMWRCMTVVLTLACTLVCALYKLWLAL